MGIYDRDYYRETEYRQKRQGLFGGKSVVFLLIMLNVVLFLANGFFTPETNQLSGLLSMHGWTLTHPLFWFELLTYGFVHAPNDLWHIICNMFVLFFFGPPVERKYGSVPFLIFYLLAILCGGLVWGLAHLGGDVRQSMLGASGAVSAVVILFSINYPQVQVLLFGIIPMPAWICGIGYVAYDAFGAMQGHGMIAHEVHLAGAGFAVLYYFLSRCGVFSRIGAIFHKKYQTVRGPRLRVVDYRVDDPPKRNVRLDEEVDQILRKISISGESSLTDAERETLRRASREYQNRMKK